MQKIKDIFNELVYPEGLNNIKEKIEILLIQLDGNILFPLRVMYKRNMNKINILIIILLLFMILVFFKYLYNTM